MPRNTATNLQTLVSAKGVQKEPIAIIGIGCRFPGGVNSPELFWRLLRDGVNAVSEIPSSRMDVETFFDPRPAIPGKMMTRWGGFLEDIDQFDTGFFGIAPREAERLDPQQRLLLEVAWEALEDAGQLPDPLKGSRTGVFVGLWLNDFEARLFADPSLADFYMTTGSGRYSASGRISYFLGLQGPSITIDTACSSSLVAVHLACQSLWSEESSLALAGGANVILQPHISIAYSQSKMMAPDGRCKFGDAQADGYVRSEGAGLVVLKRLSDAIRDSNPIYAVIRGGAVNNDGQSSGFLATPGQQGQEELLRVAYRSAGVSPREVQYVEAHGTGTRAGDPIELGALGSVLGGARSSQSPLLVGSVKTNLGHTEGAAGVAGLIKVALAIKNGVIPPSLHLNNFNPDIPWRESDLTIPTQLTEWAQGQEKIAGVSAFGIAGTNAHIVLAEAPQVSQGQTVQDTADTFILPLSAQTPEALNALARSYLDLLSKEHLPDLRNICYTASCRRTHHPERFAVTGVSPDQIANQLESFIQQGAHTSRSKINGKAKIVFVFPGQGAQWLGMGRELLSNNRVFREELSRCERAMERWADWSLLEQLTLSEDSPAYRLNEISVIQPTLFAIEVALAAVWQSWGVEPAAVVGHSMGEVAAAYVAGALSLEDAAHVICLRSQLMQRTSGQGAMAVIGLPLAEVERFLKGFEGQLSIAVQNSPRSTVVSGDTDALEVVMATLRAQEVFCRLVKVDVASHSPQMDDLRPELVEGLHEIQPRRALIPFYSTVTQSLREGESLDAQYWGRNLREPVHFGATIQRLLEEDHSVFIELSPHPILLSSIEETRIETGKPASGFASLRREQPELLTVLTELGSLYTAGYDVDWNEVYPDGGVVSLPAYPWQRERYWFETSAPSTREARPRAHPLLGQYIHSATGGHIWETAISTRRFSYFADHQVRGSVLLPAAAYVEMILAAASELYGSRARNVRNISFQEALFLPEEVQQTVQIGLAAATSETVTFHIYSRSAQDDLSDSWTLHASGDLELAADYREEIDPPLKDEFTGQNVGTSAEEFYRAASARGLDYGPNFQAIREVIRRQNDILVKIRMPEDLATNTARYLLHPILIDACFQALLAALPSSNQDTYLPTSVETIQAHAKPVFTNEMWCSVSLRPDQIAVTGDLVLFDEDGQRVFSARGLRLQRLEKKQNVREAFYEIQWQEKPVRQQDQAKPLHWLIFSDHQGTGKALAQRLKRDSQTCTLVFPGTEYRSMDANAYELDPLQPAHFQQLLREISSPIHGVVHLWSLDAERIPSTTDSILPGILHLTQALVQLDADASTRFWLVTRGAQSIQSQEKEVSITQAPVWGMGAVIANEFPNLHCTRLDLSPERIDGEIDLLSRALQADDPEDQVALRDPHRYVARLKRYPVPVESEKENTIRQEIEANQSFQVQVTTPGILERLALEPAFRKSLKAGEVEIAVKATGLNFMNVMGAMGICPGYPNGVGPLGIECSGIISDVGEGMTGFKVGDEVVAIAFDCLASHAVTDARLVVKKPAFLSFEEAATVPIAYVTAYYALCSLGRLQQGEHVLIHSATGGVGLAAIQLAKRVGAEIFATAGNAEKHDYLRALGIQHVMDSRSLAFAKDVLRVTQSEGVDLVLNSLAGNAIAKGLEILKPYGRFLEIGKRDIYQNSKVGLFPFQKNLSYFAIDLDKMSRERPELVGNMLREVFDLIEAREITALPLQTFPVSRVSDAFRQMAQAKHIGKIVITLEDPQASFELPAGTTPIRVDGTYLITGGFGGLGLLLAQWLAEQGARHLVLLGRSKPSAKAQQVMEQLQANRVQVVSAQIDVTDLSQLTALFAQMKENLPPLRGVIHAAGLLADATVGQMDRERFSLALGPKVLGAWNLHTLTLEQPLDFFVLFSSVAAILGTPGQVNYAAGNAFLDALAKYRRALDLPALSINWGPWSEVGLAAAQANRGERLSSEGLMSISPTQGLEAMEYALRQEKAQIVVMDFAPEAWRATHPSAAGSSFFADLLDAPAEKKMGSKSSNSLLDLLLEAEPGKQRRALFETRVAEQVAQVLRLPVSRLSSDKPLKTLGLDSLMSLELRNRLEDALHISLPATVIWNYPTVTSLTAFLATKIDVPLEQATPASDKAETETQREMTIQEAALTAEMDNISKAELDALLLEELGNLEDLLRGNKDEQRS